MLYILYAALSLTISEEIKEIYSSVQKTYKECQRSRNMHDKNIVITISDSKWGVVIPDWVNNMKKLGYSNRFVISLDDKVEVTKDACEISCYTGQTNNNLGYNPMYVGYCKFLAGLFAANGAVTIISEIDVIWYKQLSREKKKINSALLIQEETNCFKGSNIANIGNMIVKNASFIHSCYKSMVDQFEKKIISTDGKIGTERAADQTFFNDFFHYNNECNSEKLPIICDTKESPEDYKKHEKYWSVVEFSEAVHYHHCKNKTRNMNHYSDKIICLRDWYKELLY